MELKIKDNAATYLAKKINAQDHVLLALDDGSNKYSNVGGTCTIGSKFQLVIVDQDDPEYQVDVQNNLNWDIKTGKEELTYLGSGLNINYQNGFLSLADSSGIIDGALSVKHYQAPSDEDVKAQMQASHGDNC